MERIEGLIEKGIELRPIVIKSPNLLTESYHLKQALLPFELECLKISIIKQSPLSTREFYSVIVMKRFRDHFSFPVPLKKKEYINIKQKELINLQKDLFKILNIKEKEASDIFFGINFEINEPIWTKESTKHLPPALRDKLKLGINNKYTNMSETDKIRIKEKILAYYKVEFPSYIKILNILGSLEALQILTKRYEDKMKANFYWVLNPNFSKRFHKDFDKILKL